MKILTNNELKELKDTNIRTNINSNSCNINTKNTNTNVYRRTSDNLIDFTTINIFNNNSNTNNTTINMMNNRINNIMHDLISTNSSYNINTYTNNNPINPTYTNNTSNSTVSYSKSELLELRSNENSLLNTLLFETNRKKYMTPLKDQMLSKKSKYLFNTEKDYNSFKFLQSNAKKIYINLKSIKNQKQQNKSKGKYSSNYLTDFKAKLLLVDSPLKRTSILTNSNYNNNTRKIVKFILPSVKEMV